MKVRIIETDDDKFIIICKKHFWNNWRILMKRDESNGKEYVFESVIQSVAATVANRVSKCDFGEGYFLGEKVYIGKRHGC